MSSERKTILILGATGMLGRELCREAAQRGFNTLGAARNGADVSLDLMDEKAIQRTLTKINPDIVINAAAIVAHGMCEENPGIAYAVNARSVAHLVKASKDINARFVQISTDHFFSGDGAELHDEDAPVQLINEYARSKFAGEAFALTCSGALVVRTNITGFRSADDGVVSFIEWVFKALNSSESFNLFNDYYTSTISTRQMSSALYDLLEHDVCGRINLACREVSSKQTFVEAVAKCAGSGLVHARSISVHDGLAGRADSCGLDVTRAEKILGYKLPDMAQVVEQLVLQYEQYKQESNAICVNG